MLGVWGPLSCSGLRRGISMSDKSFLLRVFPGVLVKDDILVNTSALCCGTSVKKT